VSGLVIEGIPPAPEELVSTISFEVVADFLALGFTQQQLTHEETSPNHTNSKKPYQQKIERQVIRTTRLKSFPTEQMAKVVFL
jgi:hypothetical protein